MVLVVGGVVVWGVVVVWWLCSYGVCMGVWGVVGLGGGGWVRVGVDVCWWGYEIVQSGRRARAKTYNQ